MTKAQFMAAQKRKGASVAQAEARWNFKTKISPAHQFQKGGKPRGKGKTSKARKSSKTAVSLAKVARAARRAGFRSFTLNRRGRHAGRVRRVAAHVNRRFRRNAPVSRELARQVAAAQKRHGGVGAIERAEARRAKARATRAATRAKRAHRLVVSGYGWTQKEKAAQKKRRARRAHGFRAVSATFGGHPRKTYAYSRGGRVRHLPVWAELGFSSKRAMNAMVSSGGAEAERIKKALEQLQAARQKIAQQVSAGQYEFAPNKRRGSKAVKRSRRHVRRRRHGRAGRNRLGQFTRRYRANARKATARKSRKSHKARSRLTPRFVSGPKGRAGRRHKRPITWRARTYRARRFQRGVTKWLTGFRHYTASAKGQFNDNPRRRRRTRRGGLRFFRRNAGIQAEIMAALKFGATTFGGYAAHRVLTNLLDQHVLSGISQLSTGSIAPFRKLLAGAVVAGVGIPLAAKALGGRGGNTATLVGAGMAVSLLQSLLFAVLGQVDSSGQVAGMLAAYPNDGGYATSLGSYFTLQPHQVYPSAPRAGVGEYLQYAPTGLRQAAAGMGDFQLQQAAGEYEIVPGYNGFGAIDEGVAPNLFAAEQALNVAEAAAGLGDVSMVNTMDPAMQVVSIPDEPGGSRAGVLAGREGIFG